MPFKFNPITGNLDFYQPTTLADLGITATPTQLNYVDATSSIQGQLDGKLNLTGGTLTGAVTGTRLGLNKTSSAGIVLDMFADGTTYTQGFRIQTDSASRIAFSSYVTGDAQLRFNFRGNGDLYWGDGAVAADTRLYRSAASTLAIQGHLVPSANTTYDIGSSALRLNNIHTQTLHLNSTASISGSTAGRINLSGTNIAVNGTAGATGSFTTTDGKTVTVTKGLITAIV